MITTEESVQAALPAARGEILASMELSRSRWLITALSPESERMSKHSVAGGDCAELLRLFARLRASAAERLGAAPKLVVIQEAGFDGFWIHRFLIANAVESYVVESASIAVPRRHRRSKTDAIDGEMLLRTLMAFRRGEPRVCAMVVPPSPDEEDRRRISRERETLIKERIGHINRIKGLLATQGISSFEPMHQNCRERLEKLQTGDGRALPPRLKAEISRALDRLALVRRQVTAIEAERGALIPEDQPASNSPAAQLLQLRGIGPQFASVLWLEAFYRHFGSRRQLAAYAGLAPSPWQSGGMHGEQGISKSGNPRLRTTTIEIAWLWLRHQPHSALAKWFQERVRSDRGRVRRISIVALARKLLIALWRFVVDGVVPEGAVLKRA